MSGLTRFLHLNPFFNFQLLFIITPSEGIDFPLFQRKNSVVQMPMTFRGFSATKNILLDLDSFPEDSDSQRKLHKIVKKQMAVPDYRRRMKSKRSALNALQGTDKERGTDRNADREMADGTDRGMASGGASAAEHVPKAEAGKDPDNKARSGFNYIKNNYIDNVRTKNGEKHAEVCKANDRSIKPDGEVVAAIMKRLKEFAVNAEKFIPEKEFLFWKKEGTGSGRESKGKEKGSCRDGTEAKADGGQHRLHEKKTSFKLPDEHDVHCYYECEALPYGCMKLKHKQCPRGQFFSLKQMKCLKMYYWRTLRRKKSAFLSLNSKKLDLPEPNPEDPEPSNEWLDATQGGSTQKIPSEFKPKRKPMLKIYHLRVKRKLKELLLRKKATRKRHVLSNLGSTNTKSQRRLVHMPKGVTKRHESSRRHHPRSFLIRINKKEGKHNQESITENDENESDGDNEEGDEEEDDDEDAEEDEEEPEEEENTEEGEEKITPKVSRKESIKEFFRSAKAAVTNRAKFAEPTISSTTTASKDSSSLKSNKSYDSPEKSKQVLLDANIKVDSTFSSALKNILRSKQKSTQDNPMVDNEGLISDRGSQDQMDPELLRVYQHLIRNNPRVKRYFFANRTKKKN